MSYRNNYASISDSTRANLEDIINRAAISLGDSPSYEYGTKRIKRSQRDDFNFNHEPLDTPPPPRYDYSTHNNTPDLDVDPQLNRSELPSPIKQRMLTPYNPMQQITINTDSIKREIMTDVEYRIQEIDKNYQAIMTQITRLESLTKNNTISLNKLEGIKQSLELQIGQVIEKINQISKNQTSNSNIINSQNSTIREHEYKIQTLFSNFDAISCQVNSLIPRVEKCISKNDLNISIEKQFVPYKDEIDHMISEHTSQLTSCVSAINLLKDNNKNNNNSEMFKAELEIKIQKAITATVNEVEKKLKSELQRAHDSLEKQINDEIQSAIADSQEFLRKRIQVEQTIHNSLEQSSMSSIAADNMKYLQQLLDEIKQLKQQQIQMIQNPPQPPQNLNKSGFDSKQYIDDKFDQLTSLINTITIKQQSTQPPPPQQQQPLMNGIHNPPTPSIQYTPLPISSIDSLHYSNYINPTANQSINSSYLSIPNIDEERIKHENEIKERQLAIEKLKKEREEKQKEYEEELRKQEELERQRIEENKRRQEELERKRIEEEKQRAAEEERRKQEELERQRLAEEKKRQEEIARKKAEEEKKRQEEIAKKKAEEEEAKKAAEEKKRQEEIAKKKAEEEAAKKKAAEEAAKKKAAEDAAKKAAEEKKRQEEIAKKKAAEDAAKKAAEEKKRQEEAAKKKAEEEAAKKKAAEDAAKKKTAEDAAKKKAEEEAAKKAAEEKKRQEEIAKKKAEDEKKRLEEIAKKKAEEEKKRQEEAAKKKAEEEAAKKAAEEKKRQEEIAKKKAEEEAAKKAAEEKKRQEEIAKKKAEEEAAKKKAEEELKKQEEAKKAEMERIRLEAERKKQQEILQQEEENKEFSINQNFTLDTNKISNKIQEVLKEKQYKRQPLDEIITPYSDDDEDDNVNISTATRKQLIEENYPSTTPASNGLHPFTPKVEVAKMQCKYCLKPIDKSQEQQHLSLDCPVAAKITCSICHTTMAKYLIPNHYKQKHPEHPIPNNTTPAIVVQTQPAVIDPNTQNAEVKSVAHPTVQIPLTQQKSDSPYKQLDIINQVLDQSEEYESAEDEGDSSQMYTQDESTFLPDDEITCPICNEDLLFKDWDNHKIECGKKFPEKWSSAMTEQNQNQSQSQDNYSEDDDEEATIHCPMCNTAVFQSEWDVHEAMCKKRKAEQMKQIHDMNLPSQANFSTLSIIKLHEFLTARGFRNTADALMANEETGDSVLHMTGNEIAKFVKAPESRTQFLQMIDLIKNNNTIQDMDYYEDVES